jgi:hypothetical protein
MGDQADYATKADLMALELRLVREMNARDWRFMGILLPTLLTIAAIAVAVARFV